MSGRSFQDATVMVTGAGGGLGRAIALRFAAEGACIAALDQYLGGVEELAQELGAQGRQCLPMACDVTDADACEAAVTATLNRFGSIDVLVNNAGISHRSPFAKTNPAVIRRVMDVNFFGAVYCTPPETTVPEILERFGIIKEEYAKRGEPFRPQSLRRNILIAPPRAVARVLPTLRKRMRGRFECEQR